MKTLASLIIALTLAGCITDSAGNRRIDPVAVNSIAALAVDLAAAHFGVSPDSALAIKTAAADLAGIAAQAQGQIGRRPTAVNVAQGAGTAAIGKAVQAALPDKPIDQATVNAIFAAAAQTKNVQ